VAGALWPPRELRPVPRFTDGLRTAMKSVMAAPDLAGCGLDASLGTDDSFRRDDLTNQGGVTGSAATPA